MSAESRWEENDLGGESCHIPGIGVSLDTTSDDGFAGFGWEVEIGDAYESGHAATLLEAKIATLLATERLLEEALDVVRGLRA